MLAARSLYGSSSYGAVTVAQIISQSGVQAPTLYHHFGDKEGLYIKWVADALQELGEQIRKAAEQSAPLQDRLVAVAQLLMHSSAPDLLQIRRDARVMRKTENEEHVYGLVYECVYEPLFGLLLSGMAEAELREDSVDRVAQTFVMGAMSFHPTYALQHTPASTAARWFVKQFYDGLRSGPRQPATS